MKKFSTLLFSSLFSLSLLAFDGSRLSISTVTNNRDISIEVDGRKFAMQDNSVTLSNLSEGKHNIRIYRENARRGNGNNYGNRQEILYAGSVLLKRGYHLDITLNRFGKVFTDERQIDRNDDWYTNDFDNGNWNNGYNNAMNAREFDQVKYQISKEFHESSRLVSVKTIIDKYSFTSQQVKELMLLFTFEDNKLEVAKSAYRNTVDKNNYYQVNDALTFGNSKDELARFIRQSR